METLSKKVVIFGSTGSIGTQTLEVIDKLHNFEIEALACGKNIELLKKQNLHSHTKNIFFPLSVNPFNPNIICK